MSRFSSSNDQGDQSTGGSADRQQRTHSMLRGNFAESHAQLGQN